MTGGDHRHRFDQRIGHPGGHAAGDAEQQGPARGRKAAGQRRAGANQDGRGHHGQPQRRRPRGALAARGLAGRQEDRQPADHGQRGGPFGAAQPAPVPPGGQSQREQQAGGQHRLDHHQPAQAERRGLQHEARDDRGQPGQPGRAAGQPDAAPPGRTPVATAAARRPPAGSPRRPRCRRWRPVPAQRRAAARRRSRRGRPWRRRPWAGARGGAAADGHGGPAGNRPRHVIPDTAPPGSLCTHGPRWAQGRARHPPGRFTGRVWLDTCVRGDRVDLRRSRKRFPLRGGPELAE